jgi:hypothetical protein
VKGTQTTEQAITEKQQQVTEKQAIVDQKQQVADTAKKEKDTIDQSVKDQQAVEWLAPLFVYLSLLVVL